MGIGVCPKSGIGLLAGGDLRSDGASNEVARTIIDNPEMLPDLVACLDVKDAVVRGRAADALEKIGRILPDAVAPFLDRIVTALGDDEVPMVRWHLAMALGHLVMVADQADRIEAALLARLKDDSVFVVSWAMASLCILAFRYPAKLPGIARAIAPFERSSSAALRTRARKAMAALTGKRSSLPPGWVKSEHLQGLRRGSG
jgi:HEAT repeat protein